MINVDNVTGKKVKEHSPNWPQIPDHLYKFLIIDDPGSGKIDVLINHLNYHPDIDQLYLYAKYDYETKYHFKALQWS